jgi:hypothetical protein
LRAGRRQRDGTDEAGGAAADDRYLARESVICAVHEFNRSLNSAP